MREINPRIVLASGAYDTDKMRARNNNAPHTVTIRIIERRFHLRAGQLGNYRANYLSPRTRRHGHPISKTR